MRLENRSESRRDSRSAPRRGLLSLSLLCLADDLPNLGRLPPGRHRGLEYIVSRSRCVWCGPSHAESSFGPRNGQNRSERVYGGVAGGGNLA